MTPDETELPEWAQIRLKTQQEEIQYWMNRVHELESKLEWYWRLNRPTQAV